MVRKRMSAVTRHKKSIAMKKYWAKKHRSSKKEGKGLKKYWAKKHR